MKPEDMKPEDREAIEMILKTYPPKLVLNTIADIIQDWIQIGRSNAARIRYLAGDEIYGRHLEESADRAWAKAEQLRNIY
jgi:hypothetical protein